MPKKGFQRLPRGGYRYQYTDPLTGERKSIYAPSRAELESRCRRLGIIRADLRWGLDPREAERQLRPAVQRELRVSDAWDLYLPTLSVRTRLAAARVWRNALSPLGDVFCWELTEARMAAWLQTMRASGGRHGTGRAPKTIRQAYDMLSAALRRARACPSGLPWGDWRPPSAREPQQSRECCRSLEEFCALLLAARTTDETRWSRGHYSDLTAVVAVIGLTGIRNAEAAGLGWDQVLVDSDPALIRIVWQAPKGWHLTHPSDRPRLPPKGGKPHTQLLHPTAVSALRGQREQLRRFGRYADDGPVFPRSRAGGWRTGGKVLDSAVFRALVRSAGLPTPARWCVHSLRHTFSSLELVANQGDLRATQARTGHASLESLIPYLHALGRGQASSRLPELSSELVRPSIVADIGRTACPPALEAIAAPPDWAGASVPHGRAFERAGGLQAARDELTDPGFGAIARAWVEAGRPGKRPKEVTAAVARHYQRAYAAARRDRKPKPECAAAGARSRRAALAAWARAVRVAERAHTP